MSDVFADDDAAGNDGPPLVLDDRARAALALRMAGYDDRQIATILARSKALESLAESARRAA